MHRMRGTWVYPRFGANVIRRRGDSSTHTSIACERRRMRWSTAPLRRDFARRIERGTGQTHAKSQGEGVKGEVFAHKNSPQTANAFLTRRTRRTRRDLNSVAEETSSSEGTKKPSQALSFAFFAPSRETNLLSKFAPFGGCPLRHVSHNVRIIIEISRHRRYCSEFEPSFVQPDYMRHFFDLNVVVASRTSPLPVNVLNCHRVSPEGGWQIRTNLTGAAQRRMAHLIFHLPLARFVIQQF
jgi:hypothetical protein